MFIDTNIFIYAAGRECPQKKAAGTFLERLVKAGSAHPFCSSTEVLQELLHYYQRKGATDLGAKVVDYVISLDISILPVQLEDIRKAGGLLRRHPHLPSRDTVHVAVALRHKVTTIVSFDKDFDSFDEINRIEPRSAEP